MVTIDMLLFLFACIIQGASSLRRHDTRHDQCGGVTKRRDPSLVTLIVTVTLALMVGAKLGKDVHPLATNLVSSLCAKSRLLFLNFGAYFHRTEH
jgi:hypothetical protein